MIKYMMQSIEQRIENYVVPKLGNISGNSSAALVSQADGGTPPQPYQGLVYFGVHGGKSIAKSKVGGYYLDETYYFKITVTIKSARAPNYKWGEVICNGIEPSLGYLSHLVKSALHGYIGLATDATILMQLEHPNAQGFISGEVPLFLQHDEPIPRDGKWFGSGLDSRNAQQVSPTPMGMSQTSSYLGLHIIYNINDLQGLLNANN
jgi:hypothetical protein